MLAEGTLLGRYRIDSLAAVGGMGAVYRGTDTLLERAVALEVLLADRAGDAGIAERFACESLAVEHADDDAALRAPAGRDDARADHAG